MALQIRRGTDAERLLITPLQGELIFTTDTKKLYIGDGTTAGGVAVDTTGGGGGGGATDLDGLTDVVLTSPTTGQVLKYNGTNWVNGTDLNDGTGSVALNDVTDVVLTSPTTGQVLKFDGTNWVNGTDDSGSTIASLDDIPGVILTTPTTGQVLKFDGTNWINDTDSNDGTGSLTLNDITDVSVTSPLPNNILKYNGTSWVNEPFVEGATSITQLTDVFVNSPSAGQVLKYDGTIWTNDTDTTVLNLSDLADIEFTGLLTGNILKYDGTNWINEPFLPGANSLTELNDVLIGTPTTGQVLKFDGTNWVNSADDQGSTVSALDDLTDVAISTPVSGQFLSFNGTSWVNGSIPPIPSALSDLSDIGPLGPTAGQVLSYDGSLWINALLDLTYLSDVTVTTPVDGQLLTYDGTGWVNGYMSTLGSNLDLNSFDINGIGDISITGSISGESVTTDELLAPSNVININSSLFNGTALRIFTNNEGVTVTGLTSGPQLGPSTQYRSSRGAYGSLSPLQVSDTIGYNTYFGWNGSLYTLSAITGAIVDPNGSTAGGIIPAKIVFSTFPTNNPVNSKTVTINRNGYLAVGYSIVDEAAAHVDINGAMRLKPLDAAPASPVNGMLAVADGVSWDPVSTGKVTLVVYLNAWVQVAVSAT